MARRIADVVVSAEGRDKGKTFRITEWPAWQAEEWGLRVMSCASRAGIQIPEEAMAGNMLVVAAYGLQALTAASYDEMRPLLVEMMETVVFVPAPMENPTITRRLVDDDTEEVATRVWLRDRIIEVHTGFSLAAIVLNLAATAARGAEATPDTSTSQMT